MEYQFSFQASVARRIFAWINIFKLIWIFSYIINWNYYRTVQNKPKENLKRLLENFTAFLVFWLVGSYIILTIETLERIIAFYENGFPDSN